MSKKIEIELDPPEGELEEYEESDQNLALVQVVRSGEVMDPEDCIVQLTLSHDAMIGLGKELLRAAYKERGFHHELFPSKKSHCATALGIYLHPDSCRLNIGDAGLGTVEEALERDAQ
jgi:hypothetical protein